MTRSRRRGFPYGVMVGMGVAAGALTFALVGPPMPPAANAVTGRAVTSVATVAAETVVSSTPTTTAATVPPTSTEPPGPGELVIQGVGDVNFDPNYVTAFQEVGYQAAFDGLDGILLDDDLTVVNLECPATDVGAAADKAYSFQCDPEALPVAAANGIDVANQANNHGQDRGTDGMLDSVERLRAAGIAPVGVGVDLAAATTPAIFEVEGRRVAVLGMGGVVPGDAWLATDDHPGMASGDDIDQMVAAVSAAAEQADIVVVTIHWGRELVTEPDPLDRRRAEAMVAAGADVIFGHHSHRLGDLEMLDGVPVFWTLGNFIWPRLSAAGATTAVARVTFSPGGGVNACLIPVEIVQSGRPSLTAGRECPPA